MDRHDRNAGMDRDITRRDFLNGLLLGSGAVLLGMPSPAQLMAQGPDGAGYGGIGDYAGANGNTSSVMHAAHGIRDGAYTQRIRSAVETGETYDLVVVGGGISGLSAAYHYTKSASRKARCLILENHAVFGGASKRNEFMIDGYRLIGPQAANSFVAPADPGSADYQLFEDLNIPRQFTYQTPTTSDVAFDQTNYGYMLWHDRMRSNGYFFADAAEPWFRNPWERDLEGMPFARKARADLLAWRHSRKRYYEGRDINRWLDTMTYQYYIEQVMQLDPTVTRYAHPILAAAVGLGADVISAYGAYQVGMPGFEGFAPRTAPRAESEWHSLPGGNEGLMRHFVKKLIPEGIDGGPSFADIQNGRINFGHLDRAENAVRIRCNALAVRVNHETNARGAGPVSVHYHRDGVLYRVKADRVIMASGNWVNRRILADLPGDIGAAMAALRWSAFLVINVAVRNWRFLKRLQLTACRWFSGFGFSCNLRRPMMIGDYRPPLDPDKPAIITFYVPLLYPGLPLGEQGGKGRAELLATGFSEYERMIRRQMQQLFGMAGFDAGRDIAGIIINRWGHAFINPGTGFFHGPAAPSPVIRKGYGRIAFAHAELGGHQHWLGAVAEGRRAAAQSL